MNGNGLGPQPRGRLLRKYALGLAALVAIALGVSGAVQIWFSAAEQQQALIRIQSEKAAAAASAIQGFVSGIETQLGWTLQASAYAAMGGNEQRRFDFLRLLRQAPPITSLLYIDSRGHEQLKVSRIAMDVVGSGADRSDEPAFTGAKTDSIWRGPVYFHRESEPYMIVAGADQNRDGGVTVAEVNLKFIWDVVSAIEVGRTGRAYVVDAEGRLIAHPDITLVLRRTDLGELDRVSTALAGGSGDATVLVDDPEGRRALSTFAPIAPLGWFVFVDLPATEAFEALYASILRMAWLLLGGVVLAVVAGFMLAQRMTGPVQRLQQGAARLGAGGPFNPIDIHTGDELEALAGEFNNMAARLQESYASLEQKVAQRTRELQGKNTELEALSTKLAKYLSPQVYDSIFAGKQEVKLASRRKKLTVFFSDIAGFTEIADIMESEDLTQLLNHYLSEMSMVALEYGGTIDKFVGDAIMIFFGDPDTRGVKEDALACVGMAIAMQKRIRALGTIWRNSGIERPLTCRMGIHTGYCTVGNFGSDDRMDYTIIGGAVNLASRLEHEAVPGGILISYETYAHVRETVFCEEMGDIQVRGIGHAIATYRVVDLYDNLSESSDAQCLEMPHLRLQVNPEQMSRQERIEAAAVLRKTLVRLQQGPDEPVDLD